MQKCFLCRRRRLKEGNILQMASSPENAAFVIKCLSQLGDDIDNHFPLNSFGSDIPKDDVKSLLEHERMREQSGETKFRLVALWIDADKDARLGSFERLLKCKHVNLGQKSSERFASIISWNHAIFTCEQSQ